MSEKKYRIKEGVAFKPYGERSLITNENLTDAMAEMFIARDKELLGTVFEETNPVNKATTEAKKKSNQ